MGLAKVQNLVTIGLVEGHAFLIKDIKKLAENYSCKECNAKFTKIGHLYRHTSTFSQGETKIFSLNKQVEAPQTTFE